MLVDLIFYIVGFLIISFTNLLSSLQFLIPSAMYGFISWMVSQMTYFGGVLDLPIFFLVATTVISFEIFWFLFLIAWYIIGIFQGIFSRSSHNH